MINSSFNFSEWHSIFFFLILNALYGLIYINSWTRAQVEARAHPNFLKVEIWLNNLYHDKSGRSTNDVNLSIPLTYADRFRIRKAGVKWEVHPPHIDGEYARF
jgi:hypothetical protein